MLFKVQEELGIQLILNFGYIRISNVQGGYFVYEYWGKIILLFCFVMNIIIMDDYYNLLFMIIELIIL